MGTTEYRSLLLHMEWADSLVWTAVRSVLEHDDRILELFYHFHSTQWAYLHLFQGSPVSIPDQRSLPDLPSVARWARQFYRELAGWRDALGEADLTRNVEFPWAAAIVERFGSAGPASVGDCVLQLALHTAHHRGQVVAALRKAGGEPPMTDFITWIWLLRPAPRWGGLDA